ncbi:Maf family protein [Parapedobacter koreensis]|uniref:dTTP/UTP pyrophosphatase n=1 Tax=Parapedobacter koreensis TaxID=332977 RepID=A0A1H7J827_9SPHI|nr:Maf family nucleotide pyrophosphatase [Parapedobacter koreensis]SEK70120.1 septum formation protein [Parapedobacter koreensis]
MKIILASQSPRRKELLSLMGIPFEVVVKAVDESFPDQADPITAAQYVAEKKARAFITDITDELVIAADTMVAIDGLVLGKPADKAQATDMLMQLSGRKHEVITAVALLHQGDITIFYEVTAVYFRTLAPGEITHYIDHYQPFDKAGAYGIQEWIGAVAIEKIEGSYTNVVGLPTARLSVELQRYGLS